MRPLADVFDTIRELDDLSQAKPTDPPFNEPLNLAGDLSKLLDGGQRWHDRAVEALRKGGAKVLDARLNPNSAGQPRSVEIRVKLQDFDSVTHTLRAGLTSQILMDDAAEKMALLEAWFGSAFHELAAVIEMHGLDTPATPTKAIEPKPEHCSNPLLSGPAIHPDLTPLFDAVVMVSVWSHAIDNSYSEMLALKVSRGLPTADEWPDSPALRRSRVQHAKWVRAQREEYANRGEPVSIADFREPEWTEAMREWSDHYLKWCDAIALARELAKSGAVAAIMDAGEVRPAHKWTTQTIIDLDHLAGTLHPINVGGVDGLGFIRGGLPPLPTDFPARAEAVGKRIDELRAIPVAAVPAHTALESGDKQDRPRAAIVGSNGRAETTSPAHLLRREIRAWVRTDAKLRSWLLDKWKQGRSLMLANPLAAERVKWSQFDPSERPSLHAQVVVALHDVESAEPIVGDAHHTEWNRTDDGVDWAARGMAALGAMDHPCGPDGTFDPSLIDIDAMRESFEAVKSAAEGNAVTPRVRIANDATGSTDTDWRDIQARLLLKRDRGEPYTSLRKLCAELVCSDATIRKAIDASETLKGWKARSTGPKATPKATDLGAVVRDNTRQTTEPSPEDVLPDDDVDATMARLIDQAKPHERAKLNALDDAGRRALVAAYQSQCLHDEPSPLESDTPGERPRKVKQHKRA